MSDFAKEAREKLRRSVTQEFIRMEDDYDATRTHRETLMAKVMEAATKVELIDPNGIVLINDETDTKLRVIGTAMKLLVDTEKATGTAISLKLKQQEQEAATSAAARDRIAVVLKLSAPGAIPEAQAAAELSDKLAEKLADMFDGEIQPFEMKSSPTDLEE